MCSLLLQGAALCLCWLLLPCSPLWVILGLSLGPAIATAIQSIFIARSAKERAFGFLVQFLCRVAVIIATAALGIGHWPHRWLVVHLLVELCPAIGSVINVLRIPEKWAPGHPLFIYAFQSHTLMHVLVAVGMLGNHFIGLQRAGYVASNVELSACAAENAGWLWPIHSGLR